MHAKQRTAWTIIGSAVLFWAFAAVFSLSTGLFQLSNCLDGSDLLRVALIAIILPALGEEVTFRGPLRWWQARRGRVPSYVIGISLALFVLWHPLNAMIFLPAAKPLFFDTRFLTIAFALGAVATFIVLKSRKLWPAILFHWLSVVGWKTAFGGPAFL